MTGGRIRGLDGLRAIAVLMVMAHHSGWRCGTGGWLGVDIFFVISGYLITSQLLKPEWTFGQFIWRRLARLCPALLTLCITVAGLTVFGSGSPIAPLIAGAYLYTPAMLLGWLQADNYLGHTWSLAVEMQFYLAWAMFMLMARSWPLNVTTQWTATFATAHLSYLLIEVPARKWLVVRGPGRPETARTLSPV
jgi:peptidoglycan/LPS O-acetylase OafA/YrhL